MNLPADFILDNRLEQDSIHLFNLKLSQLRLMKDARFIWLILVPQRANASEIFDLGINDQKTLWDEITFVAEKLKAFTKADKMNVAALGNMVKQLHIHIVARHQDDAAWPKPVWSTGEAVAHDPELLNKMIENLTGLLNEKA